MIFSVWRSSLRGRETDLSFSREGERPICLSHERERDRSSERESHRERETETEISKKKKKRVPAKKMVFEVNP